MPEKLTSKEVNSETNPSVAKLYDRDTPRDVQWKELYETVDGKKISMAIAKCTGPDILYLANKHSKKFQDWTRTRKFKSPSKKMITVIAS